MTRGQNYVGALFRRGAPVLASTPRELPPGVDDPEPLAAAGRLSALARSRVEPADDPLMIRATRYAVLLPLAYRLCMLPAAWLWLVLAFPATAVLNAIAWLGIAGNAASILWVLRVPDRRGRRAPVLLAADAAFALVAAPVAAFTSPAALYWPGQWVTFVYLTGTVALWTIGRGVPAGLLVAALGTAMEGLLRWAGPLPPIGDAEIATLVSGAAMLVVAVVASGGALLLIGLATRLALAIGLRLGHTAERDRAERILHDTALQALEAIALSTSADDRDPRAQLARVRDAARAQARELRRVLGTAGAPDGLATELAAVAAEMARDGLRAELSLSDIGDDRLSEARRAAMRDAVREALRNTLKHAGTRDVVVRMEERDGGIAVVTRDHGAGYDEEERPPGFGVSESMTARLAEVGGWCRIESRPGDGTRATLWVPR
ncbi:ATP-binding protein [Amycolatopsis cynarae]|uniref:ATP-binding protein n=1 Tax=Amycolatopsis cynarae TaxID=2995223 RepID=A0ABY7B6K4_9PSEU|nr:ATP-binding protein [Amycolatopsis sp. HUAS 11-8]WAL67293.1 ATP-binding protein [Amycolatopsis sp. HUAS 11-8]